MKSRRSGLAELHWPLLVVVLILAALGCYNLHSAAAAHDPRLYLTQMVWFGMGLGVMAVTLSVDYRVTEGVAYTLYAVVTALLAVVLVGGKQAMGARRWLIVGPLTFQPSELAKIALILCMARYFSTRVPAGGYSIKGLMRPLNPTRPLGCLLVLALGWRRPWLADPMGEIARGIHVKLAGSPPALEQLLWFRALLVALWAGGAAAALILVVRGERAARLLHPWPRGRRNRLLLAIVAAFCALAGLLATQWHAPWAEDPLGVAIALLDRAGGAGGRYAVLSPSWLLRAVLLLAAAAYLTVSVAAMQRYRRPLVDLLVAPLDLLLMPAVMTLVQPDLGTATIIFLIGMTMIFVVGIRLRSLFILAALGLATSTVAWFGVLKDYQKRRILTFIDPEQDVRGAGWNAVQSLIAVGSGRWFGKGHKGGTQTQLSFLPEQHTDFAFSVWAEEQGFIGCCLVLLLYLALLVIAFAIATEARDAYGVLLATGVAANILWQAVINIGMVIGALPVVGLTLPLFSYGGSSVLTVMLGVGLLLNIHWRRRA